MLTFNWPGPTGSLLFEYWEPSSPVYLPPALFHLMVHLLHTLSRQYKQFSREKWTIVFILLDWPPPSPSTTLVKRSLLDTNLWIGLQARPEFEGRWMMEVGGLCSVIIMTGCMEYGERYLGVICGRCVSGYNLVIHHVKWLPGTAVVLYFTTLGI